MSAASLPYHLRPHKSVDRRLFLELLSRYERWRPIDNYAYVSMGAYALEDHRMVHRRFGISRLVAFDRDANTVARQKFNRPVGSCRCLTLDSGEMIDRIDDILEECGEEDASGVVVWLDYTDPKDLGKQVREFQQLLGQLAVGDVVRITVNAHAAALGEARRSDGTLKQGEELRKERFARLEERISEFLPSDASPIDVERVRLPRLLARALGQAAMKVMSPLGEDTFSPLSIVSYADGQRMLSITGALVKREREEEMRSVIDLENWPFKSSSWNCMASLDVPDLTIKERMFLAQKINAEPHEIARELGFEFEQDIDVTDFVTQYRRYYRFYPTLIATEV